MAVFLYHLRLGKVVGLISWVAYGYSGVGFFFVLSGFVLAWSTPASLPARIFWRRRFARIYPATLLTIVVALFLPHTPYPVLAFGFTASVFLVQAWFTNFDTVYAANAVTWSLSAEAFFYLLMPSALRWAERTRLRTVAAVAIGYFMVASVLVDVCVREVAHNGALSTLAYTDPAVRSGEFLLGAALAVAMRRGWRPRIELWIGLIVIGLLAMGSLSRATPLPDVWLTPCWLGIIGLAVARDVSHPRGLLSNPAMVYAGEVSFCFYLVHQLTVLNLRGAVGHGGIGVAAASLALSTLLAVLLHHLVEIPCQRWLRGDKAPPSIATAPPSEISCQDERFRLAS